MASLGGASLSWVSDYTQFYLIDTSDHAFSAPEDITDEIMAKRFVVMPQGLVVYTIDSLSQVIVIRIFDAEPVPEPVEMMSGRAWTQVETMAASFPTRRLVVSSPSTSGMQAYGAQFNLPAERVGVRISWCEDVDLRYEADRVAADVIQVELWPA